MGWVSKGGGGHRAWSPLGWQVRGYSHDPWINVSQCGPHGQVPRDPPVSPLFVLGPEYIRMLQERSVQGSSTDSPFFILGVTPWNSQQPGPCFTLQIRYFLLHNRELVSPDYLIPKKLCKSCVCVCVCREEGNHVVIFMASITW